MAKKRYPKLPEIEERDRLLKEAASQLVHEAGAAAVCSAWSALIHLWEEARGMIQQAAGLWIEADQARGFLGHLERAMTLNLPRPVLETLEGRANGPRQ